MLYRNTILMTEPEISGRRHEECDGRDEQEGERVQGEAVAPVAEVVRAHAGLDGVARHLLRHAVVQLRAAVVRHG